MNIVILTGAGISQESGIKTFRDAGGLWENHPIEEVASYEGFVRNPELVQNFYNLRRRHLLDPSIQPNPAHFALAELESKWRGHFMLVSQNIDDLHERAGSKKLLHMHGELLKARCQTSEEVLPWRDDLTTQLICPKCEEPGCLRPHIVWFGEMPFFMDEIYSAIASSDVFVAIGTSGNVYPAAGFVHHAPSNCLKIEINAADTAISTAFDEHLIGPASSKVKEFVAKILVR